LPPSTGSKILKDGASAIYGTDAIGGVINFILRKNYNGLQAQAFTDITEAGGGNIARVNLVGGFGDLDKDRFNLLVTLAHSENKALRGDQRDFVNTFQPDRGLSVDTRGAPYATVFAVNSLYSALSRDNINNAGRSTGPTLPGGTQTYNGINVLDLPGQIGCNAIDGMGAYDEKLWATPNAAYGCAWDTGRAAVLQQQVKNTNLVARGTVRLGDHHLVGEFVGAQVKSAKSFSNNQISTSTTSTNPFFNLAYPSSGAAYNSVFNELVRVFPSIEANRGLPMALRWRCMPCGPREVETQSDTKRVLLGADGPLFAGWDYRVGISQATSQTDSVLGSGYYYSQPFVTLINTGVLNPFALPGQSQTDAAVTALNGASAQGVKLYGGKFTLDQVDFTASGPVGKLGGGDVMAAVGMDLRNEKYKFNGDERDLANQRAIFNAPFDNINALGGVERKVKAVFGEVLVPLTKQLELTVAARLRRLHRLRQHHQPEGGPALHADRPAAGARRLQHGLPRADLQPAVQRHHAVAYSGKDLVDPAKCPSGKVDAAKPECARSRLTSTPAASPTWAPRRPRCPAWAWSSSRRPTSAPASTGGTSSAKARSRASA
jgi:iron complex outermembrane receptor protein